MTLLARLSISDSCCCFEKLVARQTYYLRASNSCEEASRLFFFSIFIFFTPKLLRLKGGGPRKLIEEGETSLRFFVFSGMINISRVPGVCQNTRKIQKQVLLVKHPILCMTMRTTPFCTRIPVFQSRVFIFFCVLKILKAALSDHISVKLSVGLYVYVCRNWSNSWTYQFLSNGSCITARSNYSN